MSNTPRTDGFFSNPPEDEEAYQFARALERGNTELRAAVREYLAEPSIDGRAIRQQMRARLAELSQP